MTQGKKLRRFDAHRRSQSAFFKQKPMLVKDLELALSELIGLFVIGTNLARPLEMQHPLNEHTYKTVRKSGFLTRSAFGSDAVVPLALSLRYNSPFDE